MSKTNTSPLLYLALDQGGHSSRAIVMDAVGRVVAEAQQPISTERLDGERVEHDALELVDSLRQCCQTVADSLGDKTAQITSAGLATQRSSIVCWEKSSARPITPVLSWQDRRAWRLVQSLASEADKIKQISGLVLSPHYGASKLRWCLDNAPGVAEARENQDLVMGPLASFLVRQLTGDSNNLCDPANASRTQLWSRYSCSWSDELCALFGVDKSLLPDAVPSKYPFGNIQVGSQAVPLQLVTGDQSAAIYAFGKPRADTAYINIGTGAFIQNPVGSEPVDVHGMLNSIVYQDKQDSEYVLEGTVNGAGSALSWLADQSGNSRKALIAEGLDELKQGDPPVFLNGISGLGSPYWVSDFDSEFIPEASEGLKALAILESIAFLIQANILQMESAGRPISHILLTGGLSSVDYLCQAIADIGEIKVQRSGTKEATAKGLVYLMVKNEDICSGQEMTEFRKSTNRDIQLRYQYWQKEMAERRSEHDSESK